MTSRQLLDFVERKLKEYGVDKLVPDDTILERHARRLVEQRLASAAIAGLQPDITKRAAAKKLPADLRSRVANVFTENPRLPWDAALAKALTDSAEDDGAR